MKVISFVIEGLERAAKAGCMEWLFSQDADVICLQDTRCSEYSLQDDKFSPEDYFAYHCQNPCDHSRNGVSLYCRTMPKAIIWGMGFNPLDSEGLYIQADYRNLSIGSVLIPSALNGTQQLNLKLETLSKLGARLEKIRSKRRGFVFCGGWELTAHQADVEEEGDNTLSLPGVSSAEQRWLLDLYDSGYADAFRFANVGYNEYTWWPNGDDAGGLRTDTQIISDSLVPSVQSSSIYIEQAFSHHAPVIVDYDLEL